MICIEFFLFIADNLNFDGKFIEAQYGRIQAGKPVILSTSKPDISIFKFYELGKLRLGK